jgi:uncharacterized protein
MMHTIQIRVDSTTYTQPHLLRHALANELGIVASNITHSQLIRRSIDARGRQIKYVLQYQVYVQQAYVPEPILFNYKEVHNAKHQVVIVGAGPAGLFCALQCLLLGIKPIVIERGKDVRDRRRDLAQLNKQGILNTESNYCFGEGGAGTYSDGKLYTRSSKRGSITHILQQLVYFGAQPDILIDAHPHIGTNKLPQIITAIRQQIIDNGGQVLFNTCLQDIIIQHNKVQGIVTNNNTIPCSHLVLATGHSARDVYELLVAKQIQVLAKPLAIGVRVEHPQQYVDEALYHQNTRDSILPPASYSLVCQVQGKGVFSFCMCPGGIIAPASVQQGSLVVNGWSPSKRNNPYANSGIVVSIDEQEYAYLGTSNPLAAMQYQQSVEEAAYKAGGGKYVAPAQRLSDFVQNKCSSSLPACSYLPGLQSTQLNTVLPQAIASRLAQGFKEFNKKMKGYIQHDAVVVATESRTSAPVRIPRLATTMQHPHIQGLYPCGEGAGYAGGIVSAAIDGVNIATTIHQLFA